MKRKTLALLGFATLAGLTLASCNNTKDESATSKADETTSKADATSSEAEVDEYAWIDEIDTTAYKYTGDGSNLDVYINYKAQSGVSYHTAAGTNYTNPIDGQTYTEGRLLPAWQSFNDKLGVTIKDASAYGENGKDDNGVRDVMNNNNFKSETDPNANVDLVYNSTGNINTWGSEGKAIDLTPYIKAGKMPNLTKYLQNNKDLIPEISKAGKIYFTPYLDGYQNVERSLVMDSEVVATLLDSETAYSNPALGQVKSGKGGDAKTVGEAAYTPFIDAEKNYPNATTDIKVAVKIDSTETKTITVKQTKNIIVQQNELLAAGCTGKELRDQFVAYLGEAYGETYTGRLADIFCGIDAVYNADDLVALMRVFKANPDVLYQNATEWSEVVPLFPRGADKSRVNNIIQWAGTVYGVQGMGAETGHLYYDANGKLNDAETTQASYDMLYKLQQLYAEGLILKDFYSSSVKGGTAYLDRYFKKSVDGLSSFGLMEYDYTATQSVANDYKDGLGTKPSARKNAFANTSVQGVEPILAPVTWWATGKDWDHNQALENKTGKTLERYYEENRACKTNSWCIPATTDNLDAALALMDYMYSDDGWKTINFGTPDYYTEGTLMGEACPIIKEAVFAEYATIGGDIWNFYRQKMGTTTAIGHYRPTQLDYQSTNYYSQEGYNNLATATKIAKVNGLSLCKAELTWDTTIKTAGYPSMSTDESDKYKAVTSMWANDKLKNTPDGWVTVVVSAADFNGTVVTDGTTNWTMADVKSQFTAKDTTYLYKYAQSVSRKCIPAYAMGK